MGRWALLSLLLFGCRADSLTRADHYVTSARYDSLVIELDWMLKRPSPVVIGKLEEGLVSLIDKPGGITFEVGPEMERIPSQAWDLESLTAHALANQDVEDTKDTITMHVMFLGGYWHEDTETSQQLGVALDDRRAVVFIDVLRRLCFQEAIENATEPTECFLAETGVFYHELGHLLGLVNRGLEMVTPHEDPDHPQHDENPDCIMHWSNTRDAFVDFIRERIQNGNEDTIGFDESCKDDLRARRERFSSK